MQMRPVLMASAAALMIAMFGVTSANAADPQPPQPPTSIDLTMIFPGSAIDKTQADAEAKAKEDAAKNKKAFTDANNATCVDKKTDVTSNQVGGDQYLARATTTSDCKIPIQK